MIWLLATAITVFVMTTIVVALVAKFFVTFLPSRYQFVSYSVSGILSLLGLYLLVQGAYRYFDWAPVGGAVNMLVGFIVVAAATSPLHAWLYGKFNDRRDAGIRTGDAHG